MIWNSYNKGIYPYPSTGVEDHETHWTVIEKWQTTFTEPVETTGRKQKTAATARWGTLFFSPLKLFTRIRWFGLMTDWFSIFCCIWSEWPTKRGSWYLAACRSFQTWIWGSWPGHGAEVGKTWCKNDEKNQKNWCYWRKCGFLLLGALAALAMVAASQEQRAPPDLEAKKFRQITGGLVGYHDLSRCCAWWITS